MATHRNQKVERSKVIGAVSKFAGVLVGTAVVTGKRIVKKAAGADEVPSSKPGKKSVRAPAKKKPAGKTKVRKVKKKEIAPGGKEKTRGKSSAQSPAKKRKHQAKIS